MHSTGNLYICIRSFDVILHRYSSNVITNWLIVAKNPFLKWQWIFSLLYNFPFPLSPTKLLSDLLIWEIRRVSYKNQELLISEHMGSLPFFFISVCCCSYFVFVLCFLCIWIVHSGFSLRASLTFISSKLYISKQAATRECIYCISKTNYTYHNSCLKCLELSFS
jgi:hypothetical protein